MKHYDVIIVGAGQACELLSKSLAKSGRSVALIESTHLGGSCAEREGDTGSEITARRIRHTLWDNYRIVESQLIGDQTRTTERVVPYAIFTDPELGRVGMSKTQARAAGKPIKVIIDSDTQRILGAAVLCIGAAELVHIYVALMNAKAPYTVLENATCVPISLPLPHPAATAEGSIRPPKDAGQGHGNSRRSHPRRYLEQVSLQSLRRLVLVS